MIFSNESRKRFATIWDHYRDVNRNGRNCNSTLAASGAERTVEERKIFSGAFFGEFFRR